MSLAHITGNAATRSVPLAGKTYTYRLIDIVMMDEIETHIYSIYRDRLRDLKADYSPEAYQAKVDELLAQRDLGEFGLLGSVGQKWTGNTKSAAAPCYMLTKIIGVSTEEAFKIFLSDPTGAGELFTDCLRASGLAPSTPAPPPNGNGSAHPFAHKEEVSLLQS